MGFGQFRWPILGRLCGPARCGVPAHSRFPMRIPDKELRQWVVPR